MKNITVEEFLKKIETGEAKKLTLQAAKELKGKKIAWSYFCYEGNEPTVEYLCVGDIISQYDYNQTQPHPRFKSRSEYWESYMDWQKLQKVKETLVLLNSEGNDTFIYCHPQSLLRYKELMFTCSDVDREVYYIEIP